MVNFVRFFWTLDSSEPYLHRHTADGCVELLFHYKGAFDELTEKGKEKSALSLVQGPSSQYRRYETLNGFGIFGVYLYPYVLPCILPIPSPELSNQALDLFTLMGGKGKEIEDQMMLAGSNDERVRIISNFLEERLSKFNRRDPAVFYAINSIIRSGGSTRIKSLAEGCFLSRRQFERRFKHYAGFSPKTYARIIRFQEAANKYGEQKQSLSEIALDCGYYDQSHFIHDFKAFSGYNPKAYFSGRVDGVGWRDAEE